MSRESLIQKSFQKIFVYVMVLGLILAVCGCSTKEVISYDINTYLSNNSNFEKNISNFMPTKDDLKKSNIEYYCYYDNGKNNETSEKKMIQLTLKYTDEHFGDIEKKLEDNISHNYDETTSRNFYYNDILYQGFIFYNNGYCAVAYGIITDSKTISYIAFDSWDLQFMDIESAFELFIN